MAIVERVKFSSGKLERLQEYLEQNARIGKPVQYEIRVDGLKAVLRTERPELFHTYDIMVDATSDHVEVIFYKGLSRHSDRHIFYFREVPQESIQVKGLSEAEVDVMIEQQLAEIRKERELDELKTSKEKLEKLVVQRDEKIATLEQKLEEFKDRRSPLAGIIGEVGANILGGIIKQNPKILTAFPGGESLAGFLGNDELPPKEDISEEREVSFKAVQTNEGSEGERLSEEEKLSILFVSRLRQKFDDNQFAKVVYMLEGLAVKTELIDTITDLIRQEVEQ